MPIIRGSDNVVKILGPTKDSDGTALDNTNASATSTFNMYNERAESRIFPAVTRFRAAVASGTTFTIPHTVPQWLEDGDKVFIIGEDNQKTARVVLTVTPGTDASTPATNFDTVVLTNALLGPVALGGEVILRAKSTLSTYLPLYVRSVPFVVADNVEVQLDDLTVLPVVIDASYSTTTSTEDGFTAKNQHDYPVINLFSALGVTAAAERRVRSLLTPSPITMSEYPTGGAGVAPIDAAELSAWITDGGFSGTIPDTQLDLEIGDVVRVEILFNGGAGLFIVASTVELVVGHGG